MVIKEDQTVGEEDTVVCVFCGNRLDQKMAWAHVDGDANMGVKKIEYFCSLEHKSEYFGS
ncbi:hypothetical protein [Candidatus Nitrosocosmicus franklandus]|uniref:Uncharacterized protein n=1 Tax=Candidatus Nitrosocosmicus franklandianus TaxID=1798806 RepID=A0A484I6V9_9ARCH|nr:hypothetical protein [Candidatus Nitrosocosmicus franklandus]VFJ12845.1 conserved protein of unknown function [Candidatus Nitrosocosmicus franklandus]